MKLLLTFPDHYEDKIPDIKNMFMEIENKLSQRNNKIDVKVVVNLEIAKKKLTNVQSIM